MNSTVKTALIIAGVAAAGFIAWKLYQRSQQQTVVVSGGTTVNQPAAQDKTAQIINAGSAAVSKISDFFN